MPYFEPSFGGQPVFGYAVSIQHAPNPVAMQLVSYFGVHGSEAVVGGSRGRTFSVSGLFVAESPEGLKACVATLLSMADGIPRALVDADGVAWPDVIFPGRIQEGRRLFNPNGLGGYAMEYRAQFLGLT